MKFLQKSFPASTHRVRRRLQVGIAIGLLAGLMTLGIVRSGILNPYGAKFSDLFYRPRPPSGKIVLVTIDDQVVEEYEWPIERATHSVFLLSLVRAQPRVVVLDLILPDPSNPDEDHFFAQVIQRADRIIQPVLGIESTRFSSLPNQFPAFDAILKPAATLRTPNTALAHAMLYPDPDGIIRRVPFAIDGLNERYPSIALAAVGLYLGRDPKIEIRNDQMYFEDKPLWLDSQGQVLINFVQTDALVQVSYSDITHGRIDPSILRDKIVLVGPTTRAVHEHYDAPLGVARNPLYNVQVQAHIIETLLSGNFLREQDPGSRAIIVIIVGLMAGASFIHLRRRYALALGIIYFAIYVFFALGQFDNGVILAPLDVVIALLLTLGATVVYRYFAEERTRALIARLFLGTVAPEAVDQVLALYDRGGLSLRGGKHEVTVLAITLRGFAPLSEAAAPEAVIKVMNDYSAHIFEIVFQHGGSIHSHVANTIIAMWNLPLSYPDYTRRAVQAAFEIRKEVLRLNETASQQALLRPQDQSQSTAPSSLVESGFGVATGAVITGRLTSSPRGEYSVIGDVVNVAERLSIMASLHQVFVDAATREEIHGEFESEPAHPIHIRGKKDPVQVWELRPKFDVKEISAH